MVSISRLGVQPQGATEVQTSWTELILRRRGTRRILSASPVAVRKAPPGSGFEEDTPQATHNLEQGWHA